MAFENLSTWSTAETPHFPGLLFDYILVTAMIYFTCNMTSIRMIGYQIHTWRHVDFISQSRCHVVFQRHRLWQLAKSNSSAQSRHYSIFSLISFPSSATTQLTATRFQNHFTPLAPVDSHHPLPNSATLPCIRLESTPSQHPQQQPRLPALPTPETLHATPFPRSAHPVIPA